MPDTDRVCPDGHVRNPNGGAREPEVAPVLYLTEARDWRLRYRRLRRRTPGETDSTIIRHRLLLAARRDPGVDADLLAASKGMTMMHAFARTERRTSSGAEIFAPLRRRARMIPTERLVTRMGSPEPARAGSVCPMTQPRAATSLCYFRQIFHPTRR